MGSDSDWRVMSDASQALTEFGIPHEVEVVSAHRTPDKLMQYAREARARGIRVIIAGAGGAAHLPGMLASMTPLPVVGVPVPLAYLDGMDSLLSIVQMPAGIPVATVSIGGARNAGILADPHSRGIGCRDRRPHRGLCAVARGAGRREERTAEGLPVSVAAPRAAARAGRPLIETRPLRDPDSGDPALMGRRGWWLVVMNVLVPGSAQVLSGRNRRLGRFGLGATLVCWLLIIAVAILALVARPAMVWLATGPFSWPVLTLAQVLLIGYAILWVVLTFDTLRLVRLVKVPPISRIAIPVVAVLVVSLLSGGAVYGSTVVASGRGALDNIFGQSGPSVAPVDGYYNILLLGADSGDGRDSMRFDSLSVVSVNADTGAVTIFGIPRELPGAPFSDGSPMQAQYPNGFEGHSSSYVRVESVDEPHPICRRGVP